MVVRISGDFWGNFNDGENLRSTFLLSPEHIFSFDKSPEHILGPYFTPEHRDFGKSYWNQALFQNKRCNCANLRKVITTKIWNSAVNHMLKASTKTLVISRASTFAEKNKFKYVVLILCVCIFKLSKGISTGNFCSCLLFKICWDFYIFYNMCVFNLVFKRNQSGQLLQVFARNDFMLLFWTLFH